MKPLIVGFLAPQEIPHKMHLYPYGALDPYCVQPTRKSLQRIVQAFSLLERVHQHEYTPTE